MPDGELVTNPVPVPSFKTVRVLLKMWKVAVTVLFSVMSVIVQVPTPEQPAPDQPPKYEPSSASAVKTILSP